MELPAGIRRITTPLPTRPGHVHSYLLPGDDGWTLVDTGIGPHPDLNIAGGVGYMGEETECADSSYDDEHGHGTHVTGTIAQDWNDGVGVAGIAPLAAIMPVKVCQTTGCPGDMIAAGIRWAVDHGAQVINMSLGGPTLPTVEREALTYAEEQGVVVVAASGNGSAFVGGPNLD